MHLKIIIRNRIRIPGNDNVWVKCSNVAIVMIAHKDGAGEVCRPGKVVNPIIARV